MLHHGFLHLLTQDFYSHPLTIIKTVSADLHVANWEDIQILSRCVEYKIHSSHNYIHHLFKYPFYAAADITCCLPTKVMHFTAVCITRSKGFVSWGEGGGGGGGILITAFRS